MQETRDARSTNLVQSEPAAVRVLASQRLLSLDAFRGFAVAGMILVADPGTYSAMYPPLLHAAWNGATTTDVIFPAFRWVSPASFRFKWSTVWGRRTSSITT
jgi:predicted acyltransferase